MGVLHHANYVTYFEIGRTELLRSTGISYKQLEDEGLLMVIVRIGIRYRKPAKYDDLLTLRTKTIRAGGAKIDHTYQLFRGDELICEGESTLACVDRQGKVQRVPEWLRLEDEEPTP